MKTYGGLFERVVAFENLLRAARRAQRGKRFRDEVAAWNYDLERNVIELERDLRERLYRPGPFRTFRVTDPKERIVSAPCYRDRVVHHALCAVIEPIFDRAFVHDTYACRRGKGTHRALDRFTSFARTSRYALHLDVEKYFPTVDHAILKQLIRRKIRDREVLWLCDTIVDSSPEQEVPVRYFPGDDLFTPFSRRKGLPIGSLTSQVFANLYLSPIDHLVKDGLGWPRYIRYMDDMMLLGDDKRELRRVGEGVREVLGRRLRLYVHPRKTVIAPLTEGIPFLGFRAWPFRRRIAARAARRYGRRLRELARDYREGAIEIGAIGRSVEAFVAHASFGNTMRLRQAIFSDVAFSRGEAA